MNKACEHCHVVADTDTEDRQRCMYCGQIFDAEDMPEVCSKCGEREMHTVEVVICLNCLEVLD